MVTRRLRALRADASELRRQLVAALDGLQRLEDGLAVTQRAHISQDVEELVALRSENRRLLALVNAVPGWVVAEVEGRHAVGEEPPPEVPQPPEVEGRAEASTARGGEQGATGQPTAAPAPEAAAEGGPAEWQWVAPPEASYF